MEMIFGTALVLWIFYRVAKEFFLEFGPSKIKTDGKAENKPNEIGRINQFLDDRKKIREQEAREEAVQQSAEQIRDLIFHWAKPRVVAFQKLELQWKASQQLPFEDIPKGSKGNYIVYKIFVANMIYIGFTSRPIKQRIKEHLELAKSDGGSKLHENIRAWGFKFEHEIITKCSYELDALHREMIEIQKVPIENRLNNSLGGEGSEIALYSADIGKGKRLYGRNINVTHPDDPIGSIFTSIESLDDFKKNGPALEAVVRFLQIACPTQSTIGLWNFHRENCKYDLDETTLKAIETLFLELHESNYLLSNPNALNLK